MADILTFNIPLRIRQLLHGHGVRTFEKLTQYCRRELSCLPKLGPKSSDQIEQVLAEAGLSLKEDPFGPYTCARHGYPRGYTALESMFLC